MKKKTAAPAPDDEIALLREEVRKLREAIQAMPKPVYAYPWPYPWGWSWSSPTYTLTGGATTTGTFGSDGYTLTTWSAP